MTMGTLSAQTTRTVKHTGYTASTPVNVRLYADGKSRDGALVGYTDDAVVFRSGREGQQVNVPIKRVDRVFFDVAVPRTELNDALLADNWSKAGILMLPVVRPLVPYLDLPQNNGVELVYQAAHYLMKSTGFRMTSETSRDLSEARVARAKSAFQLFHGLGKVSWHGLGLAGQARSAEALLALGKRGMADDVIERMAEPFPGDEAIGYYWMVRGSMALSDEDYSAALDGAVRAVCFANKDIDVFPDALLLSARCYEKLESYHRARDVYYEVARLFPSTAAGKMSLLHLKNVRASGRTDGKEARGVVNVFFGVEEDMNKKADRLLDQLSK
jgi:tetratricopeptide (TPR) repeat protein